MSQGPAEENPRLDEEVREAERRLVNLTASSDDVLDDDDALTDDDARAPDEAPSEGNPHQE
ncbi:hypothetical protein [Micromonospora sp. WMMC250]|uniref:hypothetical protein n=1 Tax=Micromonospora sp. WMMC250 TaxID=3014781 RepID=UPI0022B6527D|nr:hypothetical protein [Micromonospora sp. WMMC250]MCZ7375752.1 hypothetical protein [Micromonospora sp. WMMC250]